MLVFLSSVTTIAWKRLESVLAILEGELVLSFRVCQAPKSLKGYDALLIAVVHTSKHFSIHLTAQVHRIMMHICMYNRKQYRIVGWCSIVLDHRK